MNHSDLVLKRVLRGTNHDFFPVNQDLAFIRIIDSRDHVHQGRLAAAVLTENRQDLSLVHIQIHMVIRDHRAESFGDPPHLKRKLFFHGLSSTAYSIYCIIKGYGLPP